MAELSTGVQKKKLKSHGPKIRIKSQPRAVEDFFKARSKQPSHYTFTEEGDLFASGVKEGEADRIIPLPTYRPLTDDELKEREIAREDAIKEAKIIVDNAQRKLKDTIDKVKNGIGYKSQVVLANVEVGAAMTALREISFPLRGIETMNSQNPQNPHPSIKKIILSERYETRKMPYEVHLYKHRPFTLESDWSDQPVPEVIEAAETVDAEPTAAVVATPAPEMTTAERGRLGGILKVRRKTVGFA